jgi:ribonuclease P protein component
VKAYSRQKTASGKRKTERKNCMKKEYRVKKSQEFAEIMNYKKFYTCPSFAIYVKPRKEDHARVGISVGKKMGKAVVRNKIKRQVRMMVQDIYSFEEKFDTIILVRVKYHEENYINNKKLLERLVKKVKI